MVEKKRTRKTTAKSQKASDLPEQHAADLNDFLGEDTANEALGDLAVDDSELSLEALFKRHGIEFPSMPVDDIMMSDTAHEMENFSLNEMDEPVAEKKLVEPEEDDPFKEIFAKMGLPENFNDIDTDQFAQESAPFMDEPAQPKPVRNQKQSGASMPSIEEPSQESIFETEAFEDVNADFPEEKRSRDIPETSLFDYDLNESNDAMAASELGGAADVGDVPPTIPPRKREFPWASKFPNKRILLRAGILVGLGAGIYLLLQGLLPRTAEDIPMSAELESPVPVSAPAPQAVAGADVAKAPDASSEALKPIASSTPSEPPIDLSVDAQASSASASVPSTAAAATTTVTPPASAVQPAKPLPSSMAPATANVDLSNLQAQATGSASTASAPVLTAPKPATTLAVTPAGTATTTEDKLDQLEVTLKSLDQRLMQLTNNGSSSQWTVNPQVSSSDTQVALNNAVKKMNELDKKLGRIAELQQQLRALDTEVQSLKNSVSQQNEIMGAQQRLFNGNIASQDGYESGPVKMFVQAAIPGRAWLRSEQGELITVIPGDEVPGYGRVMNIDAVSGTVVTSSRAVFREQ